MLSKFEPLSGTIFSKTKNLLPESGTILKKPLPESGTIFSNFVF